MNFAIVIKDKQNPANSQLGYVRPLIIESQDGSSRPSCPADFPNNNSIFITHGYQEGIDRKFDEGELFKITYFDNRKEEINQSHCHFVAKGADSQKIISKHYPHVVCCNTVSPQTPHIETTFLPKRYIFIHNTERKTLTGPFDNEMLSNTGDTYTIFLKSLPLPTTFGLESTAQWIVIEFAYDESILATFNYQSFLTLNLSDIIKNKKYQQVDFILDEHLIKWANKFLSNPPSKLSSKIVIEFREALSQISLLANEFDSTRLNRVIEILDKTEYFIKNRSTLITDYLSSSKGQWDIYEYFQKNQEIIIENQKDTINRKFDETHRQLEDKHNQLNKKIEALINQKQQIELEIKLSTIELTKKKELELTERIKDLQSEGERLKRKNEDEQLRHQQLKKAEDSLKITIGELQTQVNATNEHLRKRLCEIKPYVDLLNGYIPESSLKPVTHSGIVKFQKEQPKTADELCDLVVERLLKFNRTIDKVDIANLLICIYQNFLVVFAGLPGTGKTSLVSCLSKVLGLTQRECPRFLHIATARGWISQRDILGFYNALTGNFQPSSTGLYHVLKSCSEENKENSDKLTTPQWILLDEANLSPIEHYWSSFMLMCDPHTPKTVDINQSNNIEKIFVPDYIRFLATVNFDHTTEKLSPRIINRAPIILMDPVSQFNMIEISETENSDVEFEAVSTQTWHRIFGEKNPVLSEDESKILRSIIDTLHSINVKKYAQRIIISPRKQKMISLFCAIAKSTTMRDKYELCALDYAIAQHVLPLINGSGENYKQRLLELKNVVSPLDRSKQLLDQIISIGDSEHGFYQFFC